MSVNVSGTFYVDPNIITKHKLDDGGAVQQFIDSEIMRYMEPYMQLDTGMMISSMINSTEVGSGIIRVETPYAHKRLHSGPTKGLRGPNYFERMKADHKEDILRGAAKIAGGKL